MLDVKSKRKAKLAALAEQIATARSIVAAQQELLEKLRLSGQPTLEAEAAVLRTYASSLTHLLAHAEKMRKETLAKKGETKKRSLLV